MNATSILGVLVFFAFCFAGSIVAVGIEERNQLVAILGAIVALLCGLIMVFH